MSHLPVQGKKEGYSINITGSTIFRVSATVLGIVLAYLLREVLLLFVVALLLAALIDPFAHWLSRHKVPRGLSVLIVYVVMFGAIALLSYLVVPPVIDQAKQLLQEYSPSEEVRREVPVIIGLFEGRFIGQDLSTIVSTIRNSGIPDAFPQIMSFLTGAFGVIVGIFVVLVLAFYMVTEDAAMQRGLRMITPKEYEGFVMALVPKVRENMGLWLRGQLMLMGIVFVLMYIILEFILNIPFALVLALTAGLLEIVPFVGPILAAFPAIFLAFAVSPFHAFLTALAYFGVQQLEGEVLLPKIMQHVTGLNPIVSIISVLAGYEIGGPIGAIIAIPLAVVISVVINEVQKMSS